MSPVPPRLATWLLKRIAPAAWLEPMEGDLAEEFASRLRDRSAGSSRFWYWRQVLRILVRSRRRTAGRSPASGFRSIRPARLFRDLSGAWRTVRRQPRYAALLLLVLGASLGTSGAVLAIVDAYLWKPLPYPESDRLVEVSSFVPSVRSPRDLSALDHAALGDLTDLTVAWDIDGFTIVGDGRPQSVLGRWITSDVFSMFGVRPVAGRVFTADEVATAAPVAVISHTLWQERYAGDAAAVGMLLTVRGVDRPDETLSFTIIGVLPPRFWHLDDRTDLLLPLRGPRTVSLVRLTDNLTVSSLAGQLEARVRAANSEIDPQWALTVTPLHDRHVTAVRGLLQAIAISVGLLVLVACSNLALLQAVRGMARHRELAVRAALGASPARIAGQLILEGALLAAGSFIVALVVAQSLTAAVLPVVETHVGRLLPGGQSSAALSGRLLFAMAGVSILATVVLGLLPILPRLLGHLAPALYGHASGTDTRRRVHARYGVVALQVAATMTLLVGAGLMLRTAWHLGQTDLGFEPDGILSAGITLHEHVYPSPDSQRQMIHTLSTRLESLPQVEAAGLIAGSAFGVRQGRQVAAEGQTLGETAAQATTIAVNPSYFAAVRLPIFDGRALTVDDRPDHDRVGVISTSLARQLWPDRSAVGQRLTIAGATTGMHDAPTNTLTVVGVAGDVTRSLTEPPIPEIYVPLAQSPSGFLTLQLRAHAGVSGLDVLPDAARAVLALDPELPLGAPAALESVVAREGVRPRFLATVLAAFAVLAAVVALIGVYAISAWVARQRRREAAVRLALGATPGSVVRALTQRGTIAVGVGLGAGWIGSIGLARLLAGELSGVDAGDPWIRTGTALLLFGTCVLAVVWPARKVAVIDPAAVFRE